jgi:nitroreductase
MSRPAASCCIIDMTIAMDLMSQVAMADGLGTCWMGAFTEDQVKRILGIPENNRVVAMLALGYPAEAHASRLRKKLEEIVAYDGWQSWPPGVPVSFSGGSV